MVKAKILLNPHCASPEHLKIVNMRYLKNSAEFITAYIGRAAERKSDYFKTPQDETGNNYRIRLCALSGCGVNYSILEEHANKTIRSIYAELICARMHAIPNFKQILADTESRFQIRKYTTVGRG